MAVRAIVFFFNLCCLENVLLCYEVGIGRSDCTGPSTEIRFMGYAKLSQVGCGLHLRQFSRAFVIDDGKNRVAFVTVDSLSMANGIRQEVLKNLEVKYPNTYNEKNLVISGTHTHSTPGGWFQYFLLDLSVLGFIQEGFDAMVKGITESLITAHENLVESRIFLSSGTLLGANINRSPAAYLLNPKKERSKYKYDVDKEMVQIKFVRSSDNVPIGAINWFAIHPTSMNNTNCLISSDNVGYASILLETYLNKGSLPGQGMFIGAFASTNLGDVSPNTKGPICIDTGKPCDFITSSCHGKTELCIASGPGSDMFESTKKEAEKLFNIAKELFHSGNFKEITGPVKNVHQYVDMPKEKTNITSPDGTKKEVRGCLPALGYSFAGGTTDGPGLFPFYQGTSTDNFLINLLRNLVFGRPPREQIICHAPKPILLYPGRKTFPYPWDPQIVPVQIVAFGEVALIAVPGEFTTMAGRRLRNAVKEAIIKNGGSNDTIPIIAGHSNDYSHYIATAEEYQRYEGAATLFGPHTLDLYINKYVQLAASLMTKKRLKPGPSPAHFPQNKFSFVPSPHFDSTGYNKSFGDCLQQPPKVVSAGETVIVKFVSGNPRHDLQHGGTYLSVEKLVDGVWTVIATDANWETKFLWKRISGGKSEVSVEWDTGTAHPGLYRIKHSGHYKTIRTGRIYAYDDVCKNFTLI